MHTRTEGKVRIGMPRDVELMRIVEFRGVTVGGSQETSNALASPERMTGELGISRGPPRLCELDG